MNERDRKIVEWLKASRPNPHSAESMKNGGMPNWRAYLQNRKKDSGANGKQ